MKTKLTDKEKYFKWLGYQNYYVSKADTYETTLNYINTLPNNKSKLDITYNNEIIKIKKSNALDWLEEWINSEIK